MVSRAFSETSGKIWSRTSPRAGEGAAAFDSFADGGASVCREAGAGAAAGADPPGADGRWDCAAEFFAGAVFKEFCDEGFGGGVSRLQAFRLVSAEKRAARMPMSWMK